MSNENSKCRCCLQQPATWSWQPFGPDESPDSFTLPGNHYHGFPVVKVCDDCKRDFQEHVGILRFHSGGKHYAAKEGRVIQVDTKQFTKTHFMVTVLSEEPYHPGTLAQIHMDGMYGDTSLEWHQLNAYSLTGETMAKELMHQGSDPEFFQIDADGLPLEEDAVDSSEQESLEAEEMRHGDDNTPQHGNG